MAHDFPVGAVRVAWSLAAVGMLMLLAGCGAHANTAAPAPAPAPTSAASSAASSAHALGQTVDADHSFVEATVYSYQQPAASGAPAPNPGDYTWAAVDVQTCASTSSIFSASVSTLSWFLVYSDQTEVGAARVEYPQFPQPAYPVDQQKLQPGQCVRGWVMFPAPSGIMPVVIRYAPFGATPVDWRPNAGS